MEATTPEQLFLYHGAASEPNTWAAEFEGNLPRLDQEYRKCRTNTRFRNEVVPGKKRMAILLRYLATGKMFKCLGEAYGISQSTTHAIVMEGLRVLMICLWTISFAFQQALHCSSAWPT
eukprot:23650-Chlamydomonas_euryale.AAC.1